MAGIIDDLTALQGKEQTLSENKVSRFAYEQSTYDNNIVAGVSDYAWSRGMNVPQGTPEIMKVSQTVIDKGWRTQADFLVLTRMLMNHFLGRISYNLNKLHDNLLSLIPVIKNNIGVAGGMATLGSDGYITPSQFPFRLNSKSPDAQRNIEILADDIETDELASPDPSSLGKVWAQSNKTVNGFNSVYFANGIWVAGSIDIGLWWSNDGKTWTQSNKTTNSFLAVYYANGIWVAVSFSNEGLWWSYDGKTWTQSNKTDNDFLAVYYANGIWVAGSYSNEGLWWSYDGKTWTQSNKADGSFIPVYFANGIWVAGSTDIGLWWSSDGKTWMQSNKAEDRFYTVYFSNGIWVAGSDIEAGLWFSEPTGTTKDMEKILAYLLSKVG